MLLVSLLICCVIGTEYVNLTTGYVNLTTGYEDPFTKLLARLTHGPQDWNLGTMRNAYVVLCPDAETWEACNENHIVVNLAGLVKQVRDLQQAVDQLKK
jgi:hypothetical protein